MAMVNGARSIGTGGRHLNTQQTEIGWHTNHLRLNEMLKGEVRRKMNFTYVLGFVVLRDVV